MTKLQKILLASGLIVFVILMASLKYSSMKMAEKTQQEHLNRAVKIAVEQAVSETIKAMKK